MNYSPELNKKLELYAGGWLEGRELHDFEQMLKRDAELRKEARFRKSVVDAIREAREIELKSFIHEKSQVRLASNPWGRVWTIASIVIIGIAAAFYFIDFNKFSSEEKSEAEKPEIVITPPVVVQEVTEDTTLAVADTNAGTVTENTIVEKEYTSSDVSSKPIAEISKDTDTANAELENGEEIIVKRDELLATLNLKVIDKSEAKQPVQENLSSSTIEKLNPEGKLPDPPPQQEMYRVELWKSPINFKGYRLVKNRLTLFGVEQNVILRLYKIDDELYLEYEPHTFSKLYQGDQFNAFVKIRDPEKLTQLTQ